MSKLHDQIDHLRRQERRILIATAGALAAVGLLGYWPARAKLNDVKQQTLLAEQELAENKTLNVKLPRDVQRVKDAKANLDYYRQRELPDDPQTNSFIAAAEALETKLSIEVEWSQGRERAQGTYGEQDVELQVSGDFMNVYSFMRQLEDMSRLLRVSSLNLVTGRQEGQVEARLTVTLYHRG